MVVVAHVVLLLFFLAGALFFVSLSFPFCVFSSVSRYITVSLVLSLSVCVCLNIWYSLFFSVYLFPSFGHLISPNPSFLVFLRLFLFLWGAGWRV